MATTDNVQTASQATLWFFKVLGKPELLYQDQSVKLKRKKSLALLCYLLLSKRSHAREALAALFWPDQVETKARTNLRSVIADINAQLGDAWSHQDRESIAISTQFNIGCDLTSLESACANDSFVLGDTDLDNWSAPFMEASHFSECDIFEEWLYSQRQACRQKYLSLLTKALRNAEYQGNRYASEHFAQRLIAFDPLYEPAYATLMRQQFQQGHSATAKKTYYQLESILDNELAIKPNKELQTLFSQIEQGQLPGHVSEQLKACADDIEISEAEYCKNGDVHIAFKRIGSGKPVLVMIWGFASHLDQLVELPCLKQFFLDFARYYSVIAFDKRGMGLSDRLGKPASLEDMAGDVICILDHLGIEKASLMGISEGGPTAITCAHKHPQRISQLLLYGTSAKWVQSPDYPYAIPEKLYDQWVRFLENNWGKANNLESFAPSRIGDDEMTRWWSKCLRMSASPGSVRSVIDQDRYIDVRDLLPDIKHPTLVLHKAQDKMIRVANGRYLAEHIQGARYVEFPGEDHWVWASDTGDFFRVVESFAEEA